MVTSTTDLPHSSATMTLQTHRSSAIQQRFLALLLLAAPLVMLLKKISIFQQTVMTISVPAYRPDNALRCRWWISAPMIWIYFCLIPAATVYPHLRRTVSLKKSLRQLLAIT